MIEKAPLNRFIVKTVLMILTTMFNIIFQYYYLKQMTASLGIDFEMSFYLMFIGIPSYFLMMYPPSVGVIESSIAFSTEFSTFALKKWRKDFFDEFDAINCAKGTGEHELNVVILRKSKFIWVLKYSEVPNKRACSLNYFTNFFHPARPY